MIRIFPAFNETIVLPEPGDQVLRRIRLALAKGLFGGNIWDSKFIILSNARRPPQFQAVVWGTIEPTSRGSLIFLRFELMPATRLMLIFFCSVLIAAGVIVAFRGYSFLYPIAAISLSILFRAIALSNLRIHGQELRRKLVDILS